MFINYGIKNGTLLIACCHGSGGRSDSSLAYNKNFGRAPAPTKAEIPEGNNGAELVPFLTQLHKENVGKYDKISFLGDVNLGQPGANFVNPMFLDNTLAKVLGTMPVSLTLISGNTTVVDHAIEIFRDESNLKVLAEYPTQVTLYVKKDTTPSFTLRPEGMLSPTPSGERSPGSPIVSSSSPTPPVMAGAGGGDTSSTTVDYKKKYEAKVEEFKEVVDENAPRA